MGVGGVGGEAAAAGENAAAEETRILVRVGVQGREGAHVEDEIRLGKRGGKVERAAEARLRGNRSEEILDTRRSDGAEHLLLLRRGVGEIAHLSGRPWRGTPRTAGR